MCIHGCMMDSKESAVNPFVYLFFGCFSHIMSSTRMPDETRTTIGVSGKSNRRGAADPSVAFLGEESQLRDRIAIAVGDESIRGFSGRCGFSHGLLCAYMKGQKVPGLMHARAIALAGNVSLDWLATGQSPAQCEEPPALPMDGYVAIALYNDVRAAAGHGAVVEGEKPDDALIFKEEWVRQELGARPADLCLIRVSGDSMEPTLRAGDVILIDVRASSPDREGIYIIRMDGMLLVKRIQALPGGNLQVTSDNPAFTPWQIKRADIDGVSVAVVGRVVWSGRRL